MPNEWKKQERESRPRGERHHRKEPQSVIAFTGTGRVYKSYLVFFYDQRYAIAMFVMCIEMEAGTLTQH
jgi:hypothetical protein